MKKEHLNELIRLIVRGVLKEYMNTPSNPSIDKDRPPGSGADDTDEMTSTEKAKQERDAKHDIHTKLDQNRVELDAEKKQVDFYKKKEEQSKKYNIPRLSKDRQNLLGAKI